MPSYPDVSIKTVAQRIVAVYKFRGSCDHERGLEKLQKLHSRLVVDGLISKELPKALIEATPHENTFRGGAGTAAAHNSGGGNHSEHSRHQFSHTDALVW